MLIFGAVTTLLMLYYATYLWRSAWNYRVRSLSSQLEEKRARTQNSNSNSFSIIVPARNEAENIESCLQALLSQDFPSDRFEIILVNDHSEDDTVARAQNAAAKAPNFKLLHLHEIQGVAYKKAAVAHGIASAKGDIVITTDADCSMGPNWLQAMSERFLPEVGMVSGPVVLESKTVFEHFQALEFMGLNAVGAAAIHSGSPTMCNGANLAYRKAAFDDVGGFKGIDHIASGDDELLMHKIAAETQWKVDYATDRRAIVRTAALPDFAAFRAQRLRWVSKSTQYKRASITATLVISWLAMAGIPLLLVAGFFDSVAWYFLLGNLFLKMLGEFPILFQAAGFFNKLHLLRWFVPEQLAHIVYVLWVGLAGNSRSYTWKGREVK